MPSPHNNTFKVYQASAGSGKTYTIVKEYLKLCLKSQAAIGNYSQILAITFTNMAANEMKDKIVKQLVGIINSDNSQAPSGMEADLINELAISRDELKANAHSLFLRIIYDYSNFYICTIDAFVQKLARSFAKDLGLPSQFNVSIDEEEVADNITERIGEQIGESNPELTKIVVDYTESKLEEEKSSKVATEIHRFVTKLFKEEAFQKDEDHPFDAERFTQSYAETLKFINDKIYPFEARCQTFAEEFGQFIEQNQLTADDFNGKSRSACLSILSKLKQKAYPLPTATLLKIVNGEDHWYQKSSPKPQLDEAFEHAFLRHIRYYAKNIGAYHFYKTQRDKLSLYVLRSKLIAEIEAYIGEEQMVPISEFNKRINLILGDFSVPFIYERMGNRFKHVFIDEFQDTSVLQWQNLIPLLHNGIASGYMSMVVGDGKQSIYRWRSGEVEQIVKLPEIHLKPEGSYAFDDFERSFIDNFSFNELKTNYRSFSNIIQFNNDFFSSSLPLLGEDIERKVYADKNERYGKEVSIIQLAKHTEPGYVEVELFDPDNDADEAMLARIVELIGDLEGKGFQKSDITILVRTNKYGSLVAEYLSKQGIPVISADSILLKSSSKVRLIISTLDYLVHPNNPVSTATMNYYWNLVRCEQFNGVADGFFDHGPDVEAFKALMIRSYSLYDLCSALMRLYGLESAGDTHLSFLLDVVYKWQSADESGISSFMEYWEKKKNVLTVASGNTDAVQVMTIHKSKGLEYNVVICPFVKDNLEDRRSSTFWVTPEELGFDAIPNIGKVQFTITKDSMLWSNETGQKAREELNKVRLDNMNLNYVAFTRAVQRLHILSYRTNNEGKNPLNAFLETHPAAYGDPDTRKVVSEDGKTQVAEFYYPSRSSEWFNKISVDPDPSMFWVNPDDKMKPQEWGDFVHQVLSEIKHTGDIDRALAPHVDSGVIDLSTADMLKNLFLQMATHPLIGDAFTIDTKVKNECDILLSNGKILRPDRYAEMPDKIYLLDYKTGKPDAAHHRQLAQYVEVLKKMVAKPIEAYLVYLGDAVDVILC